MTRSYIKKNFDRSISSSSRKQFLWLLLIIVAFFVIPFVGFGFFHALPFRDILALYLNPSVFTEKLTDVDSDYTTWYLVTAFVTTLFGVIAFTGMLVAFCGNMIQQRIGKYKSGEVEYMFKKHSIILGYEDKIAGIVKKLLENGEETVIVTSHDVERLREHLNIVIGADETKKIILIHGSRISDKTLSVHIKNAKSVYIIGEEDDIDHDTLNINCLELIKDKYKSIDCHVFLKDQTAYSLLKTDDKYKSKGNIKLSLFGYCEEWAREVLVYHSTNKNYPYLDRDGIGIDSPKHVHFVINGMTQMGMTMVIEACHIAHFPNFTRDSKLRTTITMIDKDARTKMEHLVAVYSNFFKQIRYSYSVIEHGKLIYTKHDVADVGDNSFIDIEFEFLEGSIFDFGIREFISYLADNENTILTFASCLDDSYQNLDVCLHLPENLYYRDDIAIFTQQETAAKLLDIVNDNDNPCKKYKNVFPFGMVDYDYCGIKDYWEKAKQINYQYVGDKSKTPDDCWSDCSVIKRLSSLYCALYKQTQKRSDFVIDGNKCATDSERGLYKDETEHNRWNVEKLLMGFRPVTSEEASDIEKDIANGSKEKKKDFYKEHYYAHYDIRPYSELCKETKEIDTRVNSVK